MSVLVYTETEGGSFKKAAYEVASYGKGIADQLGTDVAAISFHADGAGDLGTYGVSKQLNVTDSKLEKFNAAAYADAIAQAAKAVGGRDREKAEELFKTKIKGLKVEKILVEEKLEIKEEFYLSIMLDRTKKKPVLLGTIQGGVNIEKLSKNNPDMIVQQSINTIMGIENYHGLFLFSKFNIKNKK